MSASVMAQPGEPWLELPGGFPPDTVGFAVRTTLALMLAYYFCFWIQLSSASTAGVCVAIVAQPQFGGTMSKAVYCVAGTLIGGVAAVIVTALFAQDRSMMLIVFTLWLAGCSFVASLLKDFRAYGATLAGYTLAIVSITDIDMPQAVFLTALDRIAAILVGVCSLALVNGLFGRADAWQALTKQLRQLIAEKTERVIGALRGEATTESVVDEAQWATAVLALRTQASFVAGELPAGRIRAAGARRAIAGLLGMAAASQAIKAGLARAEPDATVRLAIERTIEALGNPSAGNPRLDLLADGSAELGQVFLLERLDDVVAQHRFAQDGLGALTDGRAPLRRVRLPSQPDLVGAALNATRTAIVVGLAALFCIYGNWSGATFLLVQLSAVVALLGMQPNPTRAAVLFGAQFPLAIVAGGLVEFLLLPQAGDFVLFVLAVAPFALISCVLARHPSLGAGAGTGMLIWYVLMLAPANPPTYDLTSFFNIALEMVGSVLAVIVGFAVILPVSPPRRLGRVMHAALRDVRRTWRRRRRLDRVRMLSLQYDRLAAALLWLGRRTPARLGLLSRIHDLGEFSAALSRTDDALQATLRDAPALAGEVATARAALLRPSTAALHAAGAALLAAARAPGSGVAIASPDAPGVLPGALHAASGLYGAALIMPRTRCLLRLAGLPAGS
ncbi:FUSC family protein [Rhodopila sp.]|uniref:FUSC family protein n=1 Tax=Rhodopila sp. TaxID=2480087 RepID=UPI003D122953